MKIKDVYQFHCRIPNSQSKSWWKINNCLLKAPVNPLYDLCLILWIEFEIKKNLIKNNHFFQLVPGSDLATFSHWDKKFHFFSKNFLPGKAFPLPSHFISHCTPKKAGRQKAVRVIWNWKFVFFSLKSRVCSKIDGFSVKNRDLVRFLIGYIVGEGCSSDWWG